MSALVVVGTRPEAIKLAPVIQGLRAAGVPTTVLATGQHRELALDALAVFGVAADLRLQPVATDLTGLVAELVLGVRDAIGRVAPRVVVVHGDTTSAVAGGLAALYGGVPIAHVEAGLRTSDRAGPIPLPGPASLAGSAPIRPPSAGARGFSASIAGAGDSDGPEAPNPRAAPGVDGRKGATLASPFPEEANRRLLDAISTWWFAPTEAAAARLRQEGRDPARVVVTGNSVVDALERVRGRVEALAPSALPELAGLDLEDPAPVVLVTAHRRESRGERLERICEAVAALDRVRVVWPLHPHPEVADTVRRRLGGRPRVSLLGALSYPAFVRLLLRADLVLTDSGGVQEEASVLGRPTLVLRDETERPEVLATGVVRVVGTRTADVARAATEWLEQPPTAVLGESPLGDGHAGERIGRLIAAWSA